MVNILTRAIMMSTPLLLAPWRRFTRSVQA